ncbi:hypothetical protein F5Y04DRAFT_267311 [Hypomontagnella monticulosa]|nr:hypothetical protein F5Y04DRAFT_267311 [Hypomontagnella monticulosa]
MDKYNENATVYDVRPFHSYCLTDDVDEDDDIRVWRHGREPLYTDKNESRMHRNNVRTNERATAQRYEKAKDDQNEPVIVENSMNLTAEQFRERQIVYALSTARRNLTRMSQFILKLECRAGKVTKEGIRQTLDATVADNSNTFPQSEDLTHLEEIEEIKYLSESVWKRLYLVDRHWRRQTYRTRDAEGKKSPRIQLESEPSVKDWLKEEIKMKQETREDICYFTVADLISGRKFEDWIIYLKDLCNFDDHPTDEQKLVHLAWRFQDRDLRGPYPINPTRIEDFVIGLEEKLESGGFDDIIKNPENQGESDAQAWKTIKRYWFSRVLW